MPIISGRATRAACIAAGAAVLATPITSRAAPPVLSPTNDPDAFTFAAPPPGFDPIHATAADLAAYGFPPRPKLFSDRYAVWARAVSAAKHRIFPDIQPTSRRAEPVGAPRGFARVAGAPSVPTQTSPTWSGLALANHAGAFGAASLFQIWGEWNVTRAATAFGTSCGSAMNGYDAWIALDGFGSPDMLASGIGAQVCPTPTYYDAWYQWYPAASHVVTNFAVSIGDEVIDVVWVTGANAGQTFMTNITTGAYWGLKITPPQGTALIGNSAEWIMGRPCLALPCAMTMANYGAEYFADTVAFTDINAPAGVGGNGNAQNTPFLFTLLDNNSNPISYVAYYQNNYSMFGTHVEGSAQ